MTWAFDGQPILLTLRTGDPQILRAAEDAIRLWNTAVGAIILRLVPKGTPGAVAIDKNTDIESKWEEASANGVFDTMGHPIPQDERGQITVEGNAKGLRDPVTLAHEIGHVLGLAHPSPSSTYYHYKPTRVQTVAPIGLMGNGARIISTIPGIPPIRPEWPAAPDLQSRRDMGPSIGEVRFVRNHFDVIREHAATKAEPVVPGISRQAADAKLLRLGAT